MQTLKASDFVKEYNLEEQVGKAVQTILKPVTVEVKETKPADLKPEVTEDLLKGWITLAIGETKLVLGREQALDLAHQLVKAANRIEELRFHQLGEKRKEQRRKNRARGG